MNEIDYDIIEDNDTEEIVNETEIKEMEDVIHDGIYKMLLLYE